MVGTPCVASYCGGVPDMARDGEDALFYRANDPALLAWKVKRIFDDDELALALSTKAQQHAKSNHAPQQNASDLLNAYKAILCKAVR